MEKKFVLDSSGVCSVCTDSPSENELIRCATCKLVFHALCPTASDENFICRMSFLKLWHGPSVRANFKWYCDTCLTAQEERAVSSMEDRFDKLLTMFTALSADVASLKSGLNSDRNAYNTSHTLPSHTVGTQNSNVSLPVDTAWSDKKRMQNVKASLVIKQKAGISTDVDKSSELSRLKNVAVENGIAVSRVGYDKKGNTFIDCRSVNDRNKLQPLLATDLIDKEVSVIKEKSPCISIVGIQDESTSVNDQTV